METETHSSWDERLLIVEFIFDLGDDADTKTRKLLQRLAAVIAAGGHKDPHATVLNMIGARK